MEDLRKTVSDIRKNQLLIALSEYKAYLTRMRNNTFDADEEDDYCILHGIVAQHVLARLEGSYSDTILNIKSGDTETLHDLIVGWLFDLYYSFESDISVSFAVDFVLAQHTIAAAYRTRIAIVDYILHNNALQQSLNRFTLLSAEQCESVKDVNDTIAMLKASSSFDFPLFTSVAKSLHEFKSLVSAAKADSDELIS